MRNEILQGKKLRNALSIFFISILFLSLFLPRLLPGKQEDEMLQKWPGYEAGVSAQLVPVCAVDKQGNPVYGLEREEIILYTDGKPIDFFFFTPYCLEEQQQKKHRVKTPGIKSPERINFIIIDTLISKKNTLGPAKCIAMGVINNALPGDAFVILESNQINGFQYVIGPEKEKARLAKAIEEVEREQGRFQREISVFTRSLQQLKYALKTITLPKTIFLISAGQTNHAMGKVQATYYRFLEDAARAVNYGGGMFYLVNPLTTPYQPMNRALKFTADQVGGNFVCGRNSREIITTVKKCTSAYYELAFYPGITSGCRNRIRLKCKRKGVRLTTISYSERSKPYREMNSIEKKLFILNVVNGGSWSRMVARVGRVKYKNLVQKNRRETTNMVKTIELPIPPAMRERRLDVFTVHIDLQTRKAEIIFKNKKMSEREKIRIKSRRDKNSYFVIVEPANPFCIYNQVL